MLGVLAVPAEVPLARTAVVTGHGIGAPHDADDVVALGKAGARRSLAYTPDRLVAEDEALVTGRRPAVLP